MESNAKLSIEELKAYSLRYGKNAKPVLEWLNKHIQFYNIVMNSYVGKVLLDQLNKRTMEAFDKIAMFEATERDKGKWEAYQEMTAYFVGVINGYNERRGHIIDASKDKD